MANVQDYSTLFKQVYGDGPVNLLPSTDKCQKLFPFAKGQMVGDSFVENLDLEFEHGFTFAGNAVAPALVAAIAAENLKAQITPSQIIGRKVVGYRDITRTDGAGKKAFASAVTKRITDLMRGTRRTIELSAMHGQSPNGIGIVQAVAGQVITITQDTWSPGIWAGSRNMTIDSFLPNLSTPHDAGMVVASSNPDPGVATVTVTGLVTTVAGDVLFRGGANVAGVFGEMAGLATILRNTGVLFLIDATLHNLWAANTFAVGGRLTMRSILQGNDLAVNKGLDGDVVSLIPVRAYTPLNDDINSLRAVDESYNAKEGVYGVESIAFHGQTGKIIVVPHLYMMQGEYWNLPVDSEAAPEDKPIKRIGSTDVTFGTPISKEGSGMESGDIFLQVPNTGAVEIRNFTDQCIFIQKPGYCCLGTGILYP